MADSTGYGRDHIGYRCGANSACADDARPARRAAAAQIGPGPKAAAPREAPPPAVPGAASNSANVAPATITPAEMEPNDELFDAINRGDIAAARDAISRGADLGGRNVLGMTPMELSVDLGRNDISFLLLSMRGDNGRRPPASATAAAAKPQPAKPGKTRQSCSGGGQGRQPVATGRTANPAAVQWRWRRAEPERRLPGV